MTSGQKPLPDWALQSRAHWRYTGEARPPFAIAPKSGQESVWDYPRPPRLVADGREVIVRQGTFIVARSVRTMRVLETASPPTFYIPKEDVEESCLKPESGSSRCEWKGVARYWSVVTPQGVLQQVAWSYPDPLAGCEAIRDHLAFYPARLECTVAGERVRAQPGTFYGGWVTNELVGPFKGEPGSEGW
jgi:uncharacterized protein (DUF427 family)